jgi:pimeloyl-ACP methyl ester carboxylesterase
MTGLLEPRTIVLIHGLFLTHTSWENWVERYAARGYTVLTPSWPGLDGTVEQLRQNPSPFTKLDIETVLASLASYVERLAERPIVMGHSFGGLFAQLLAYRGLTSAAVGIDPTAPAGVLSFPFSTLKASVPILANRSNVDRATMLTAEQFHYAFTNTISPEESRLLYDRYAVPCANRVLFEGAFESFVPHSPGHIDVKAARAPVLLIAGGADRLVTEDYTRAHFRLISASPAITALRVFPGRPHFTGAVRGWEDVADYALDWALAPAGA